MKSIEYPLKAYGMAIESKSENSRSILFCCLPVCLPSSWLIYFNAHNNIFFRQINDLAISISICKIKQTNFYDSGFVIGGDSQQEGLAGYRLGSAYEEIGDAETAILVRNKRGFISKKFCLVYFFLLKPTLMV